MGGVTEKFILIYKSLDGTNIILNNTARTIISYGLDLCGVFFLNIHFNIYKYTYIQYIIYIYINILFS